MRALVLTSALLAGCSTATPNGNPGDTPLEAAFCELLADGPETDVTATADDLGPDVFVDGRKVEIALIDDGAGMYSGRVRFTPDEEGSFALGLGDDVPIVVYDALGTALPFDAIVEGAACADLAVRYTVTMALETYVIEFGPTPVDEVDFVAEESDDDL